MKIILASLTTFTLKILPLHDTHILPPVPINFSFSFDSLLHTVVWNFARLNYPSIYTQKYIAQSILPLQHSLTCISQYSNPSFFPPLLCGARGFFVAFVNDLARPRGVPQQCWRALVAYICTNKRGDCKKRNSFFASPFSYKPLFSHFRHDCELYDSQAGKQISLALVSLLTQIPRDSFILSFLCFIYK